MRYGLGERKGGKGGEDGSAVREGRGREGKTGVE